MPRRRPPRRRRGSAARRSTLRQWSVWFILIVITLALVAQAVASPSELPAIPFDDSGDVEPHDPYPSDVQPLFLLPVDAAYMTRIFEERTHEIAYCAYLEGRHLRLQLADTIQASTGALQFSTNNCQPDPPGTVHTHPNGEQALSVRDKTTASAMKHEFTCIQSGPVTTEPLAPSDAIACYKPVDTGEGYNWTRIPVVVSDQTP